MIKLNGHIIAPTIFPDKTSQVWKLDRKIINFNTTNTVTWDFENEGEFMQVAQLAALVRIGMGAYLEVVLDMPYLPYARQDKAITNESTFSFYIFCELLNTVGFDKVRVFDPHNVELTKTLINHVEIVMPHVAGIVEEMADADYAVYPDAGAAKRYNAPKNALRCEKIRIQSTGEIKGIKIIGKVQKKSYIIIDDICDGGRTFIEVAKKLYEVGAKEVHLYVSHGLFSKGLDVLRQAGIKRIFTRNGEVK